MVDQKVEGALDRLSELSDIATEYEHQLGQAHLRIEALERQLERCQRTIERDIETIDELRAEVRHYEGDLEILQGNPILTNLHGTWVELELAIEYRAEDIDCEGDGDGEGTDTDPLECQHCRQRAKAEVDAFMAISAMVKGTLLAARSILGVDDPHTLPVSPVKTNLDEDIRWEWMEGAWGSCMSMVPIGRFGPYEPETYDGWPEAFARGREAATNDCGTRLPE